MKKIAGIVKLQLPAGKANPSPPVGPALGQYGANIMAFCKDFNARTAKEGDMIIPVEITIFADRSFTFFTKTPPRNSRDFVLPASRVRVRAYRTRTRSAR